MTNAVVTENINTVVVEDSKPQNVIVDNSNPQVIVTGLLGPQGPRGTSAIMQLDDVDLTQLSNGAILVYNDQTQKFAATTLLDQQIFESGQY